MSTVVDLQVAVALLGAAAERLDSEPEAQQHVSDLASALADRAAVLA